MLSAVPSRNITPAGYTYPYLDEPILEAATVTSSHQVLFSALLARYASRNCEFLFYWVTVRCVRALDGGVLQSLTAEPSSPKACSVTRYAPHRQELNDHKTHTARHELGARSVP